MKKRILIFCLSSTLASAVVVYAQQCNRGCKDVNKWSEVENGPCFWFLASDKYCVNPISAPGADPNKTCSSQNGEVNVMKNTLCSVFCPNFGKPREAGSLSGSNIQIQLRYPKSSCNSITN